MQIIYFGSSFSYPNLTKLQNIKFNSMLQDQIKSCWATMPENTLQNIKKKIVNKKTAINVQIMHSKFLIPITFYYPLGIIAGKKIQFGNHL